MKLKKVQYNRDGTRKETGLGVNAESAKYTFMYCEQCQKTQVYFGSFENVVKFRYVGEVLTTQNLFMWKLIRGTLTIIVFRYFVLPFAV